jgi:hypothetical protein
MNHAELKAKHSKEFGEFDGIFWAFNEEQFLEGMNKVGLEPDQTSMLLRLPGGGFMLKSRREAFSALCARHEAERKELKRDKSRLLDALIYELNNHEYTYTNDPTQALESLGLTQETVDPALLAKACKKCWAEA